MPSKGRAARTILAALAVLGSIAFTQDKVRTSITGTVIDDSTSAPIQNANVFLAHTTLGRGTDSAGRFGITNIPLGFYELAASRVGYTFRSYQITLSESCKKEFEIRLRPSAVRIGEVVVSAPDVTEWEDRLKTFTELFLGKSRLARECKILNPEVLDFIAGENGQFQASARAPLEIDNRALGYHIRFFLRNLSVGRPDVHASVSLLGNDFLTTEGLPEYTELNASTNEEMEHWIDNRSSAFAGSLRHFLSALFRKTVLADGFEMYLTSRLPGVLKDNTEIGSSLVSVGGWKPQTRLVWEEDILVENANTREAQIEYQGWLEVDYKRALIEREYDSIVKPGSDARVSWVRLNKTPITVTADGMITEPFPTIVSGYWAWQRLADALPLDYIPEKDKH